MVVRKDCYDERKWDNGNSNAYADSDLNNWFNGTYKNMLDADIRSLIGTTKFYYTPGNGFWNVDTLERAIFALSLTELGLSANYANTEGTTLPIASTLRIAYLDGSANTQWTRSVYTDRYDFAWAANDDGSTDARGCTGICGSRPAFTLPATTMTDPYGNVTP